MAVSLVLKPEILPSLANILSKAQLQALSAWPVSYGGGQGGICEIFNSVTGLIIRPYSQIESTDPVLIQLNKVGFWPILLAVL